MRIRVILCLSFLLSGIFCTAQFTENFNDGNYTSNPVWTPSSATDWIVNASSQLQSNNMVASSTFYISTPSTVATTAQWEFYVQMSFNTSSLNYIDVYLTSASADLSLATNTGYFVRLGNTNDDISLYRKDAGNSVMIIDGINGTLNTSNNVMKIKVIRDATNKWTLLRDLTGTGSGYTSEGFVTDNTYSTSSYFGFFVKQSTSSFFQKHFIDDIITQTYVPDITPPVIQSAIATSINTLDVQFNEPVDIISSQVAANYVVNNGIGVAISAVRDALNNSLVHLTFGNNFPNGTPSTLTVNGVQDLSANAIANGTMTFSIYTPVQYDVVIDEIMADPTPQVSLPDAEWIELRNTSPYNINLSGWKIGKTSSLSGPMPTYILKPDSFVVVCTSSAVPLLSVYGPTISVTSFPAVTNGGDLLYIQSIDGRIIHSVNYSDTWYQNVIKKDGGWTLEMIDTKNPCSGMYNWKASTDASGGTPGRINSVDGANPDNTSPLLSRAYATSSTSVTLVFNEPLDSLSAATSSNYSISDGIAVNSVSISQPVIDKVTLTLGTPIVADRVYTATVNNISDCKGNTIGMNNTAQFGLAGSADGLDVVVNEILFNPASGGYDYVEIYNRSQKIIDLSQLYVANRNTSGVVSSIYPIATEHNLLFPEKFAVMTEDSAWVAGHYFTNDTKTFIQLNTLPSFSDDDGDVILLNVSGNIIDEVSYSDKWHFPLIHNTEGVSLERIDYNGSSVQSNFHSAASSVGYGTPGLKNSQYSPDGNVQAEITVSPDIFSPDNDGQDDFVTIDYSFPSPGYVANITIFDASGRPVRYLQKNALNGVKGNYRWDGVGEKQQKLPLGVYIIVTEVFNLDGKRKLFKNTVVLARKMN